MIGALRQDSSLSLMGWGHGSLSGAKGDPESHSNNVATNLIQCLCPLTQKLPHENLLADEGRMLLPQCLGSANAVLEIPSKGLVLINCGAFQTVGPVHPKAALLNPSLASGL